MLNLFVRAKELVTEEEYIAYPTGREIIKAIEKYLKGAEVLENKNKKVYFKYNGKKYVAFGRYKYRGAKICYKEIKEKS